MLVSSQKKSVAYLLEMDDKIVALINLISPHKTNVSDSLAS